MIELDKILTAVIAGKLSKNDAIIKINNLYNPPALDCKHNYSKITKYGFKCVNCGGYAFAPIHL
jgi:hypothetical protein